MEQYIVRELLHYCNVSPRKTAPIAYGVIDYYDLTFVLRGTLEYSVNGTHYSLCENDILLIPPGSSRKRDSGACDVHYVSFNFYTFDGISLPSDIFYKKALTHEMRSLCSVFSEQHISPFYHSREKIAGILNCILFELIDSTILGSSNQGVNNALKYIDAHIVGPMSVKEIAEAVHISSDHLSHLFKRELGRPIIDYVNERRMFLARNMISSGELTLADISQALGYESYSYFSRVFKRYFGVSPAKFK